MTFHILALPAAPLAALVAGNPAPGLLSRGQARMAAGGRVLAAVRVLRQGEEAA